MDPWTRVLRRVGALFVRAVNPELDCRYIDRPTDRLLAIAAPISPFGTGSLRRYALALRRALTEGRDRDRTHFHPAHRAGARGGGCAAGDKARQKGEEGEHDARHRVR